MRILQCKIKEERDGREKEEEKIKQIIALKKRVKQRDDCCNA